VWPPAVRPSDRLHGRASNPRPTRRLGGIVLTGGTANGALVNASVRYASTGILISSGATSTSGSSVFGLSCRGAASGPPPPMASTRSRRRFRFRSSSISGGTHGIKVDFSGAVPSTPVRLSGNRFTSTSAEAILGQALAGQPSGSPTTAFRGQEPTGSGCSMPTSSSSGTTHVAAAAAARAREPAVIPPSTCGGLGDFARTFGATLGAGTA